MNKTQLAEKRYRDKSKKHKKEIRLNTKKQKKKPRKSEEDYKKLLENFRPLEFNHSVENIISTSVVLMEQE